MLERSPPRFARSPFTVRAVSTAGLHSTDRKKNPTVGLKWPARAKLAASHLASRAPRPPRWPGMAHNFHCLMTSSSPTLRRSPKNGCRVSEGMSGVRSSRVQKVYISKSTILHVFMLKYCRKLRYSCVFGPIKVKLLPNKS